ncbi:tetratricopeptide repeat protein [Flavobacteriaceae bacterium M23B6Z8]
MNSRRVILAVFFVLLVQHEVCYAQEISPNASVFTEEYTDEFQENFFEALKQYAIENYEKAITALEECKKLKPDYAVIDFELSKNYLKLRQYFKAEDYMLQALNAEPNNLWYLDGLFTVYEAQNNTRKAIEVATQLADKNNRYKENLVLLYMRNGDYDESLKLLDELDQELGITTRRRNQRIRILAMKNYDSQVENEVEENNSSKKVSIENPLETIRNDIKELSKLSDYKSIEKLTEEALETYPAQAEFYFANGLAKNKLKKHKDAISSLEMALEFLIDDTDLENQIYEQMILAYTALGNTKKAEEYNRKSKKGL